MKKVKWTLAYFSPTGGVKKVADAVTAALDSEIISIDLCNSGCSTAVDGDSCLIAFVPVYCGRVPALAIERLAAIKGNGQKAAAVVVYGNREFDDALIELKDTLTNCGFEVIAAAAFIAEHSVVRDIACGRPDERDAAIARDFAAKINEKVLRPTSEAIDVPGNRPYLDMKLMAVHPAGDEKCVKCGLCAEKCPVGAIPAAAPAETDTALCINCMRCVELCLQKARSMPESYLAGSRKMLSEKAAGYKLPEIFI